MSERNEAQDARNAPADSGSGTPKTSAIDEGINLYSSGKFAEALALTETFLLLHPTHPDALNIAAACSLSLGKPELAEAYWVKAIALDPGFADAHFNLGNLFRETHRQAEAETSYRLAIAARPDHALAYYNLARMLQDAKRLTEAESAYQQVLAINPGGAEAHNNLGVLFHESKRLSESVASYRRALSIRPGHGHALAKIAHVSLHNCDWERLEQDTQAIRTMLLKAAPNECTPFEMLSISGLNAEDHKRAGLLYAQYKYGAFLAQPPLVNPALHSRHDRLRIGYLSADFHNHATVHLMAGVLEHHDRRNIAVYAYSYGPDRQDDGRKRVVNACENFCDLRMLKPADAARRIAEDEIDILVDLKGYTQDSQLEITALRPAPVIVNWLGYPGTLGHPGLADYIIGDSVVTPAEQAADFSETLALMPHCYQPNDRKRAIGHPPARKEAGLPEQGFVFCSFNQTYKISPQRFDLWCRLLMAVNGSVLWLLEPPAASSAENLRREAARRGIDPDRLIFAPLKTPSEHLSRLQLADLALDTSPYTSHTTASDALWAGVPLITCPGDSFVSRVAASLLISAGLPECVTHSFEEYFQLARDLATAPDRLVIMRDKLARQRLDVPLFDTERFTRDIEKLYSLIWQDHGNGIRKIVTLQNT